MQITGIVAEYNPFHAGHRYHIEKAKAETEADGIIAVMSGSFVQRGEPAVFHKWDRAFHALEGGADLVLELPVLYALSSAEHFARGAVETLKATGVLGTLSFGSECGDLSLLRTAAGILDEEPPAFSEVLHEKLKQGASYAAARAAALSAADDAAGALLEGPNNILAIAYLRALKSGEAHTVKRMGGGYLDTEPDGDFPSALSLRERLKRGEEMQDLVPFDTAGLSPHFIEMYADWILYALRTADWAKYASIPETIKKRLQNAKTESLQTAMESSKTKHITMAAVKRALFQVLLQNDLPPTLSPTYIRVLGFTKRGAEILKRMKKTAQLPVITRPAAFKTPCPIWELEKRATDIYFLPERLSDQDLKRPPVRCSEEEK